ncbi:PREDICTED: uncharacterized protein LOC106747630 [Dinoponera quadriceps]|uniref:Uncharacterized protein LOC106747630 n=1 Tax=Dinoponera quadriceps TaxID=609295 RepID=A0A6P3XRY5_DINQU|nr:PREDICTED: uncharacterized protein LOC106747630 [Dinoponera quadriceps]
MSNPNRQVFVYYGQRNPEHYNQFFNPNICHVCKSVDKGNLILCNRCCLISYCSDQHKDQHHSEHQEICMIVTQVLQVTPQRDTRTFSNWQQWIQSRKEAMETIQQKFYRPMERYERQMILWSKTCVVCYQQAGLKTCQRCYSANYCDKHAKAFRTRHNDALCDRLMLLLNIDIKTISGHTANISYGFLPFVHERSRFEEMLEFCMDYVLRRRRTHVDWLAKDYVRSDYLSGPLTIYSGLKSLNLLYILRRPVIVIHILGSNSLDRRDVSAWEILLHLVPEITNLEIVMIGPKLEHVRYECVDLCEQCVNSKKEYSAYAVPMLYYDYIESASIYGDPDVIIGFHIDIKNEDRWLESVFLMFDLIRPLFLSFSCEEKALRNISKIQEIIGMNIEPTFSERNHFCGLAPHRDIDTGNTYFRNEHLIIYNNIALIPSDVPSD